MTPTSEEMAREAFRKAYSVMVSASCEPGSIVEEDVVIKPIVEALDAQRKEVARECLEIAENFSLDESYDSYYNNGIANLIKEKFDV